MISVKDKILTLLLMVLALLVALSSHPFIVDVSHAAGIDKGSILSRYIILVYGAVFALLFLTTKFRPHRIISVYFVFLLVIALFSILTLGFFTDNKLLGEIRALVISLVALIIGWQLDFSQVQVKRILWVYALATLYVGVMQVVENVGGFVVEQQYLTDNKNSLGVMLATTITIFAYLAMNGQNKHWTVILSWFFVFLTFSVILTIRARAATLIAFVELFVLLYRRVGRSNFIWVIALLFLIVSVLLMFLPYVRDFVYSSFFMGYEGGDITSDRSSRNRAALEYLSLHPFLGNLEHKATYFGWIHNYPLLQLYNNGLIFGLPIVSLYLYLFVVIIKNTLRSKFDSIGFVGFVAIMVPFIVAMAEPTFPYGPGTATVFNFILFGVALRNNVPEIS